MSRSGGGRLLVKHALAVALLIIVPLLYELSGIGCPFRAIFGFPCPTCGVTRALICLVKLDFTGYMQWQPMAVPLVFALWLCFHVDVLPVSRRAADFGFVTVGVLTFTLYIYRLIWLDNIPV